jgi:hypothetical protein
MGYRGVLCSICLPGYSIIESSSKCQKCPSVVSNSLMLFAFLLIAIAFIVVLVRSNLNNSSKEKNFLPVFLRILLNHFQILTLVGSFDFNWPEQILDFFRAIQPVSEAQSQVISVDCFIDF